MLTERIEGKWIDCFEMTFLLCGMEKGDIVAIVSETLSRQTNVHLTELALARIGCSAFHIVLPSTAQSTEMVIRSSGSSNVVMHNKAVMRALTSCKLVADLTVEGLMHAKEQVEILASGARVLYVSNDHPEILERLAPSISTKRAFEKSLAVLRSGKLMHVTSEAGTDLSIDIDEGMSGGGWGAVDGPSQRGHWPGGLVACYPRQGATNGTVVFNRGDVNCTFKKYFETPVRMKVVEDRIVEIIGDGLDAELMRNHFAGWKDPNAYYSSHVGWGINSSARWDAMAMFDKGDHNCIEQRATAGNFLFSTGANQYADRFTLCHFDLPMHNCTVKVDGMEVVASGVLSESLCGD